MATNLFHQQFYFDSQALRMEIARHHIVTKHRTSADEWTVTCSCGADTGACLTDALAVEIWAMHLLEKLRNA